MLYSSLMCRCATSCTVSLSACVSRGLAGRRPTHSMDVTTTIFRQTSRVIDRYTGPEQHTVATNHDRKEFGRWKTHTDTGCYIMERSWRIVSSLSRTA